MEPAQPGAGFLGAEELEVGRRIPTSDSMRAVVHETSIKITSTIKMSTNDVTLKYNGAAPACSDRNFMIQPARFLKPFAKMGEDRKNTTGMPAQSEIGRAHV